MSRLSGLSASYWDDATPESERWESDEDPHALEAEGAAADNGDAALAEYRDSVYHQQFIPSLTRCIPSARQGRKNKAGKQALDLTHTLFAAAELGCSVSDVAQEILLIAAEEEDAFRCSVVQEVVERLVATVELETESAKRQHLLQASDDSPCRPMCVHLPRVIVVSLKVVTVTLFACLCSSAAV